MRLGIFGGSFDPPHLGHLLPVMDAAEALGLDAVRFVPASIQPFKTDRAVTEPAHRLAMTERLVEGIPGFSADSSEIDRPGLSFSVDTLQEMADRQPHADLVLIVGADAYAMLDAWREPERIRRLATIAVLERGETLAAASGEVEQGVRRLLTRRVDISSTELRARVAKGRTIRGFVPEAVAEYIAAHRLYR